MRNKQHIYSHRTKFNRFLRILSFGTEKEIDGIKYYHTKIGKHYLYIRIHRYQINW